MFGTNNAFIIGSINANFCKPALKTSPSTPLPLTYQLQIWVLFSCFYLNLTFTYRINHCQNKTNNFPLRVYGEVIRHEVVHIAVHEHSSLYMHRGEDGSTKPWPHLWCRWYVGLRPHTTERTCVCITVTVVVRYMFANNNVRRWVGWSFGESLWQWIYHIVLVSWRFDYSSLKQ